jgi:hypothetical protein
VDGHDFIPDKDGAQSRETYNDIVFLADKEKGQDALFPEMGVASAIMDNLHTAGVVAGLNRGMGTDENEWQLLFRHSLAHIVGIALDTRHGLCQESAVDVYHNRISLFIT